jgi:putative tryptophan/tyrosine transport system substrate-binding protein
LVAAADLLSGHAPDHAGVAETIVTKMQLAINLKTASSLNTTFPLSLLGRADEVIE